MTNKGSYLIQNFPDQDRVTRFLAEAKKKAARGFSRSYNVSADGNTKHWHESTVYCYQSGNDCGNCEITRFYGLSTSSEVRCLMPLTIEDLFKRGILPPLMEGEVHAGH